jgi:hypothetical protein
LFTIVLTGIGKKITQNLWLFIWLNSMQQGKMFFIMGLTMALVQGGYVRRISHGKEIRAAMSVSNHLNIRSNVREFFIRWFLKIHNDFIIFI